MIVASHQPNFMPYMGFFYKMYLCDVFTISDAVQYSRQGYHNYNFFNEAGARKKLTVPVSAHNGDSINEVLLSDWEYNQKKLKKRIEGFYCKAPHFKSLYPYIEPILTDSYESLVDLNVRLLLMFNMLLEIDCPFYKESVLDIKGATATEQIVDICRKTQCDTYLSGMGAVEYLDTDLLKRNGIKLRWSEYEPLEYGSVPNASAFDYLMYCGKGAPDSWKRDKERLRYGKDV